MLRIAVAAISLLWGIPDVAMAQECRGVPIQLQVTILEFPIADAVLELVAPGISMNAERVGGRWVATAPTLSAAYAAEPRRTGYEFRRDPDTVTVSSCIAQTRFRAVGTWSLAIGSDRQLRVIELPTRDRRTSRQGLANPYIIPTIPIDVELPLQIYANSRQFFVDTIGVHDIARDTLLTARAVKDRLCEQQANGMLCLPGFRQLVNLATTPAYIVFKGRRIQP